MKNSYTYSNNFESIADFKDCINRGGEVVIEWKGKSYGVFPGLRKTTGSPEQMYIGEGYYIKDGKCYNALSHEECDKSTALWADTADEILEYRVGEDRLRDVITQVQVVDRML